LDSSSIITFLTTPYFLLGITGFSLLYDFVRARRGKPGPLWTAFIAATCYGLFFYQLTDSIGMGIVGYLYTFIWLGNRWNRLLVFSHRIGRVFYYLLNDIPILIIWFGTWYLWENGWITLGSVFAGMLLEGIMMTRVLQPIFPVVARQEQWAVFTALKQGEQADRLLHEINQFENNALRERTLRRLSRYQQQYTEAEVARRQGNLKAAAKKIEPIIAALERASPLTRDQKTLLGQAYLCRAKVLLAGGSTTVIRADVEKARPLVSLDEEIVGGLALRLYDNQELDLARDYGVEFLELHRGKPHTDRAGIIQGILASACRITDDTSNQELRRIQRLSERILQADPDLSWAHLAFGLSCSRLGDWQRARTHLEIARRSEPLESRLYAELGRSYKALGMRENAIASWREALRLDPRQAYCAHELGFHLAELDLSEPVTPTRSDETQLRSQPEDSDQTILRTTSPQQSVLAEGISWLEKAVELQPKQAAYLYDLARAYVRLPDITRARSAAEKAVKLAPDDIQVHRLLADLLFAQAQWGSAVPHYERAYKVTPDDPSLCLRLGTCLVETGDYQRAQDLLTPLGEQWPEAYLPLGRALLKTAQFDLAISNLEASLRGIGENGATCYYLGCAQAWKGQQEIPPDLRAAERSFERALHLKFEPAWRVHVQLGNIQLNRQHAGEAITHYQQALKSPAARQEAGLCLARAQLANQDITAARHTLESLVKDLSSDQRFQQLLGLTAELQGDLNTAERAYRDARAVGALGVMLYLKGKPKEAAQMLEQARQSGDLSDRVLFYSGQVEYETGHYQAALDNWKQLARRYPDDERLRLNITRLWYQYGASLYQEKKYLQAAQAWENFYLVYANDDETRQALRQLYLLAAHQDPGSAASQQAIERARKLGASSEECDSLTALGCLLNGDHAGGGRILETLVHEHPSKARHTYNLGLAYLFSGKENQAVKQLENARQYATGELHEQSTWALAAGYARSEDWPRAAELLQSAN
jgi:tetratricopeptide (TPR) repeat protein